MKKSLLILLLVFSIVQVGNSQIVNVTLNNSDLKIYTINGSKFLRLGSTDKLLGFSDAIVIVLHDRDIHVYDHFGMNVGHIYGIQGYTYVSATGATFTLSYNRSYYVYNKKGEKIKTL